MWTGAIFECLTVVEIKQFQVVQKSLDHLLVRVVPAAALAQAMLDDITRIFRDTFGAQVRVEFQFLDQIARLPSAMRSPSCMAGKADSPKGGHRERFV